MLREAPISIVPVLVKLGEVPVWVKVRSPPIILIVPEFSWVASVPLIVRPWVSTITWP